MADEGVNGSSIRSTPSNSWDSHAPLGVPPKQMKWSPKICQIRRGSVSVGPPSTRGMPSASIGTPCEYSMRTM
jgi:hypothetical protein